MENNDTLANLTDEEYELFKRETLHRLGLIQETEGHPILAYVTNAEFGVLTDMETGNMIYKMKGE